MAIDAALVLLYKPVGMSSCGAVTQIKRRLRVKKAGHAGTLDPCAEGLLIVALDKATRALTDLSCQSKRYEVGVRLGLRTETGDREGKILAKIDFVLPTEHSLQRVFADFSGEIEQVPPMYSALKYHGQRLYKLARANISVVRKKRKVSIYSLTLKQITSDGFSFEVHCSKGTYIRTLVEDIAAALNTIAYTRSLKRTAIGAFSIDRAILPDKLERSPTVHSHYLIGLDQVYSELQAHIMGAEAARRFSYGRCDAQIVPPEGRFRLYNEAGDLLGIGSNGTVQRRFV